MRKQPTKKQEAAKIRRMVKTLDGLCRKIILIRDKSACQKCGKVVDGSDAQSSHVIPKSKGWALRWDLNNLKILCLYDHLYWWHRNPIEAYEWFKEKFPERFEYLEKHKNDIAKRSENDYLELEAQLKEILKDIE